MQLQLPVMMPQLQLLIITRINPKDIFVGIDDLKPPKLVDPTMTQVLNDRHLILKLAASDV